MTQQKPMDRRAFLAGGIKAGMGLGLGARSVRRAISPGGWLSDVTSQPPPPSVMTEPLMPPNFSRYVSRPDLTPVAVGISTTPEFLSLGSGAGYIFCAPKAPVAANPGTGTAAAHGSFPRGATPGLMILDTSGELVWFKPLPGATEIPFNFRAQTYKGKPTLTWFQGAVVDAHGDGHYVLADNTYQTIGQVLSTSYPCDLHEFIITPEGTALHTAYDDNTIQHNGIPVFIGHAMEVDVATNEVVFDWASYPAVGLDLSYTQPTAGYNDYFHINSIDLWPGPDRDLL
ncbi:MAG TPA: arylsulfotransferase family protein, partial [Acidimicrobiales bacterium]|nr:arylsulfotransferase family protein [Acidimicrobiales bacterium]